MPSHDQLSGSERPQRQVTGRMVLICLVAFFGVVFGVNAVLVRAALTTFGGVETASSYQAGLAFARDEQDARTQDALHWHVTARVSAGPEQSTLVEIDARDAMNRPLVGFEAAARLVHPADARAYRLITLMERKPGAFVGTTDHVVGQWDLVLELSRDGKRVFRSKNRLVLG
jgi:nitrogen fixation protein FixH